MDILDEIIPELVRPRHDLECDMYDVQKALIAVALGHDDKAGLF